MILLKIIIDMTAGILDAIGGDDALYCRRFIMPCVIALGVSIATQTWWAGFMVLPVMGTLTIGYSGGHWALRGGWMALQAFVMGLGCFLTHHLELWTFLAYLSVSFGLGATLYKVEQLVGDFIFGCFLCSIIFMVN